MKLLECIFETVSSCALFKIFVIVSLYNFKFLKVERNESSSKDYLIEHIVQLSVRRGRAKKNQQRLTFTSSNDDYQDLDHFFFCQIAVHTSLIFIYQKTEPEPDFSTFKIFSSNKKYT